MRRGANWTEPPQGERCFYAIQERSERCGLCLRHIRDHYGGTEYRCDSRDVDCPADHVDPVNHPPHYTEGGIEVIDAIEAWGLGFRLANVVKYVARCDRKGSPVEDLKKAQWYLAREIAKRGG